MWNAIRSRFAALFAGRQDDFGQRLAAHYGLGR